MEAELKDWRIPVPGEDELIRGNLGLVHHIIRKEFSGLEVEYDDAYQIGVEGLLRAVRTHEPGKGGLAGWAILQIRTALLQAYRHDQAQKRKAPSRPVSLDAPISEDDERTFQLADPSQNTESGAIARVRVERLMSRLKACDREIAEKMMAGIPVSQIAEETSIRPEVVRQRIQKMRKILEEEKPKMNEDSAAVNESLAAMNSFLFSQMKRLSDDELSGEQLKEEVTRAKAMADLSTRIIQSGELVLRAYVFRDKTVDTSNALPRLLGGGNE